MNSDHEPSRYLELPEGRLAYDVRGDGPLVVGAPGMGDVRSVYRFLVPALVEAGYRVATVDLRAHGASDASFTRHDDVALASDLVALVDHLEAGPAVLMGNSMAGGAAALAAAEAPDRVSALVMLGAFVRDHPAPWYLRAAMNLALRRPWGVAAFAAYYRSINAGVRPDDLAEHVSRITTSLRRPGAWPGFVQTTRTSHALVTARLGDVAAPTLVVMGEKDPDFPDPGAEARYTADALGGEAELLMVPDAGHYPQAQRPDLVAPAVLAFLADAAPAKNDGR